MALNPTEFQPGEDVTLSGKLLKVAGLAQYDAGEGKIITRYCLMGGAGGPIVLQEEAGAMALLRPFPPAAPPVAEGSTVSVMGEKFTLAGVRKLKVLGTAGEPPAGTPTGPLMLSGVFQGTMGSLLREMVPISPAAQTYALLKPVHKDDVLSGEELAKVKEGERLAADVQAQAEAEESEAEPKPYMKFVVWAIVILVIAGLVYACSGSSDDSSSSSSSSHSVRTGTGSSSHGGK